MSISLLEEQRNLLHYGYDFDEVHPIDFYRDIFPEGELEERAKRDENDKPIYNNDDHKYCGIAIELVKYKDETTVHRFSVTDDLDVIDDLLESENFCFLSPISYAGKSRKSENARKLFALCIEIDHLVINKKGEQAGLRDLFFQIKNGVLPRPTYTVLSGSGVHLYYVFDKPILLYKDTVKSLEKYKKNLTRRLWNRYVTTAYQQKDIQYESLFQPFRLVGGITKRGERTVCFRTGDKVTIEYMNTSRWSIGTLAGTNKSVEIVISTEYDKTKTRLEVAKEKYPEWYEKRIVKGEKKGRYICNTALYEWWLRKIRDEGSVGHRYYCLMCLSIYAIKCGIDEERLKQDAFSLLDKFEELTTDEDNHFTEKDVIDALQVFYDKEYVTYPRNSIANRSGIDIPKTKRNGRKQAEHLRRARAVQNIDCPEGKWRNKDGRPDKQKIVQEWQQAHPNGKKADCIRDTGLTKPTVYKWWK